MNRQERAERDAQRWAASEICAVCGYARLNIRHNTDPASQIEGADYYADVDLHEFVAGGQPATEEAGE